MRLRLGRKASGVRRLVGQDSKRGMIGPGHHLRTDSVTDSIVTRRCEIGGCEQRLIASERPLMWKIPSDNWV